jgi:hypothetical protein
LNRDGYRYWGWYGLNGGLGIGLARSNDLIHWKKDPRNPLLLDGRWPSAIASVEPGDPTVYLAFTRNFDYRITSSGPGYSVSTSSSYIVLGAARDGIHFTQIKVLVAPVANERNNNPNLFFDPRSKRYYLTYYRGNDKDRYEIVSRSADRLSDLGAAQDRVLVQSTWTVAAPALLYAPGSVGSPGIYYLFTEVHGHVMPSTQNEWGVAVLTSAAPDGPFSVLDLPLFMGQRGCPFPHIFGGRIYSFFCRLEEPNSLTWSLEEAEAPLPGGMGAK